MTYNEIVGIIFLTPIAAMVIGMTVFWVASKLDQDMFKDDTDDRL